MLFPSIGNIDCLVFMGKKKIEKNNEKINVEESLVKHSTTLFYTMLVITCMIIILTDSSHRE